MQGFCSTNNKPVTGTRWDKSKYLQCSGSSISRLVTVNILAMSQWNVSCGHFVALSLAKCEETCPPGSYDGRIWSFSCDTATAGTLGSALRSTGNVVMGSWDSCRIGGGMIKKRELLSISVCNPNPQFLVGRGAGDFWGSFMTQWSQEVFAQWLSSKRMQL